MDAVTNFKGKSYKHSDFKTSEKRKDLPEEVKKAILGKKYIEPKIEQ